MTKKTKKLLWIIFSLFIFNWLLTLIAWSPFGWHYFFPDYYDNVSYWAPVWQDNEHILFMKGVSNWRMESPFLFFDGKRGLDSKNYLCLMKIDGTEKKEIIEIPKNIGVTNISAAHGFIVLSGGFSGNSFNEGIHVVNLRENTLREISKTGVFADISQNSEQIVYSGKEKKNTLSKGEKGIWIMDANGQNNRQLTNNIGDNHPHWSPDGNMIAFERNVEKKGKEIWVMNGEGKERKMVYGQKNNRTIMQFYDWSPDELFWSSEGVFDLTGKILQEKQIKYAIGKWSSDGQYYVSGGGAVVDKEHNIIYILKDGTIEYGKFNRKQKSSIWIKE